MRDQTEDQVLTISRILDNFDLDEIRRLLEDQINGDNYTAPKIDQFHPLYYSFNNVSKMENLDEEDQEEASEIKDRFYGICNLFIELISEKFDIDIDEQWLGSSTRLVPSIALALYDTFVLHFYEFTYDILKNYILKEKENIVNTFKENVNKKDIASIANRKSLDADDALICSSIYDVIDFTFSTIDDSIFMNYVDENNVPAKLIAKMIDQNTIESSFVRKMADIIKDNMGLRARLAFDIVSNIKNLHIPSNDGILEINEDEE